MGRSQGARAASASSIEISFEYKSVRCREKLKLVPKVANLKFAANLKARIEHEIAVGTFDYGHHFPNSKRALMFAHHPAQTVTVGELLTDWLKSAHAKLEPETYGDYAEYVANTWRPRFGARKLSDLTLERVEEWISEQTCGRSESSIC
jgi:integrase